MIYGTFVFGYDDDTPESFDRAVDFAIRHKFFLAQLQSADADAAGAAVRPAASAKDG